MKAWRDSASLILAARQARKFNDAISDSTVSFTNFFFIDDEIRIKLFAKMETTVSVRLQITQSETSQKCDVHARIVRFPWRSDGTLRRRS